jgi:hypothetical protein
LGISLQGLTRQLVSPGQRPHQPGAVAHSDGQVRDALAVQIADHAGVGDQVNVLAMLVSVQPSGAVIAVLAATLDGASINAAGKASGINYRTAQRIVQGATVDRQRQLVAVG